jgi:signal transduction histidine kinase/putative methionine-R-sulfoxide reductase with GAF domain
VHIHDVAAVPGYPDVPIRLGKQHTSLGVPLLREGETVGVIVLARQRVEPFTERQIELVRTFADQAVIAMENARLLTELRQRTEELARRNSEYGERIEHQAATIDVLKAMSGTPDDTRQVFDLITRRAQELCNSTAAGIFEYDGELVHIRSAYGIEKIEGGPEYSAAFPMKPTRGSLPCRAILDRQVIHIRNMQADPELLPIVRNLGIRSNLAIPLLRNETAVGAFVINSKRPGGFSDSQVALLQTFAEQAVIAITSVANFRALRERTTELTRSVGELQALEEVMRAVNSSLDLETVLSTIISRAVQLSDADEGTIYEFDDAEQVFVPKSAYGMTEARVAALRDRRIRIGDATPLGQSAAMRAPLHIPDLTEAVHIDGARELVRDGIHAGLVVPLLRDHKVLGGLVIRRRAVGGFAPTVPTLLQTFAGQCVLAIENARLFREIADKSEQLALASQHKSQFLANMSHELRTPLNAILGYAELLADGIYGELPERPKGVLERIQSNGRHLLALINDVLDLAKIEAGQLILTLEDYSLSEVLRSVVIAMEPLAAAKGLKFAAMVQSDLPTAHGDARRLSQVLLNLVGNAIKFTDEGAVELLAAAVDDQFVITVRDTGPGIAQADQERIFEEFQQIDNSNTRKKSGTGLGLAISRRIIEMQGGAISVQSAPGRGSTFRVVLPIHVMEMEAAE